jgi:hypothetical protein
VRGIGRHNEHTAAARDRGHRPGGRAGRFANAAFAAEKNDLCGGGERQKEKGKRQMFLNFYLLSSSL